MCRLSTDRHGCFDERRTNAVDSRHPFRSRGSERTLAAPRKLGSTRSGTGTCGGDGAGHLVPCFDVFCEAWARCSGERLLKHICHPNLEKFPLNDHR